MRINMIVAIDNKYGIGKNGALAWHLDEDLRFFKTMTENEIVIMGMTTFLSLNRENGLANRINVVITRSVNHVTTLKGSNVIYVPSKELALKEAKRFAELSDKKIFVIGGQQVFDLFKEDLTDAYITHIEADFQCDTFLDKDIVKRFKEVRTIKAVRTKYLHFSIKHYSK